MFLPRFSTRTALIILAVTAVLFAILSQGLLGVQQRWQLERNESFAQSPFGRGGEVVSTWRQVCAGLSMAVAALAVLMTINGLFFLGAWLIGWGRTNSETTQTSSGEPISWHQRSPVVGRVRSTDPSGELPPPLAPSLPTPEGQPESPPHPPGPSQS